MTPLEHKQRHIELHRSLDQLFADFVQHNPHLHNYMQQPIMALIEWSYRQTIEPDEISPTPQK